MTDRPGRRKTARVPAPTVLALVAMLMLPMPARGQILLPQEQCVGGFLNACATLLSIDFTGSTLTLIISNTSVNNPDSYLGKLLLEFNGGFLPNATSATVFYSGGGDEVWDITQPPSGKKGGFGHSWDLQIWDPSTGGGDLRIGQGDIVTVVIEFGADFVSLALFDCGEDCLGRGWTAQMQSLGPEGSGYDDSGFTSIPEPSTVFLLTTGLLGLGGVGLFRRRRSQETPHKSC